MRPNRSAGSGVPGDLTLSSVRWSRALSADSRELADVPPEPDEAGWEVEILDGAELARVLTSAQTNNI